LPFARIIDDSVRNIERGRSLKHAVSERPWEGAAVDENVLTGDESRLRAGEEGAERAEFRRIAESPGRDSGLRFRPRLIHADVPLRRRPGEARFLPVGLERSGLDRIDGDVVARKQSRRRGEERG
jgi:hypothetical protein